MSYVLNELCEEKVKHNKHSLFQSRSLKATKKCLFVNTVLLSVLMKERERCSCSQGKKLIRSEIFTALSFHLLQLQWRQEVFSGEVRFGSYLRLCGVLMNRAGYCFLFFVIIKTNHHNHKHAQDNYQNLLVHIRLSV